MAMRISLGVAFLSSMTILEAVRKVIRRSDSGEANALAESLDVTGIMSNLNGEDLGKILVDTWENSATVDWEGSIEPQLRNQAFQLFGATLCANPLLGMAFSIFTGLFGLTSDADPNAELFRKIKEAVKLMIRDALSTWYQTVKTTAISGILNQMRKEKTWADWQDIGSELERQTPAMFNTSCWNAFNPDTDATCKAYQQGFGGGPALITELDFTKLLISVYMSLHDLSHSKASDIKADLAKVAPRLYSHYHSWKAYRYADASRFVRGYYRESGPGYTVVQGQDLFVHDASANRADKNLDPPGGGEFTGPHCIPSAMSHRRRAYYPPNSGFIYQQWGRRRAPQDHLNRELDRCLSDWKEGEVKNELRLLERETNAVLKTSLHIVNQGKGRWLQQGSVAGNCTGTNGYPLASGQPTWQADVGECEGQAMALLSGIKPKRSFIVGCWSSLPKGCSVESGWSQSQASNTWDGDWRVIWNQCDGRANKRYSAVCGFA